MIEEKSAEVINMQYLINEEQWDGVDGHNAVVGSTVQTDSWWQAQFEYYYRVAYAAISSTPYHTVFLRTGTGDIVKKEQFNPERLQGGGGT